LDPERREETLGDGVVPAVAPAAHAADQPVLPQHPLVVPAGILTAAIRMMQQARRAPARERQAEGLEGSSSVMRSLIAQPTANREQRSRITPPKGEAWPQAFLPSSRDLFVG